MTHIFMNFRSKNVLRQRGNAANTFKTHASVLGQNFQKLAIVHSSGSYELEGGKFVCCKVQVFTRRKVCGARSSYYFCIKEPRQCMRRYLVACKHKAETAALPHRCLCC